MNFLQLCQRSCVEWGVSSTQAIQTALPTVVGATGSLGRIVNWVNDAWTDLQMGSDEWSWMRSSNLLGAGISFQTVGGTASYPLGTGPGTVGVLPDNLGKYTSFTFRNYTTSVGFRDEIPMQDIPFDQWRNEYMMNANRLVQTRPIAIAIGPDLSLNLGPPPNDQYSITGDYFVAPSEMVADTDVPAGLPIRFHMLIVYGVGMKYAGYESAPEVMQRASQENSRMYAQLLALRAPVISFGGALA